jgi:probable O-glycosylation ligase (exosortase A-associated)
MRDLLILLIVFGSIPLILRRAYVGVLVWSWLGYMNPHRLAWGFAYDFPFSQVVAIVTLVSLIFDRTKRGLPINALTIVWIALVLWMNFTTLFALNPEDAYNEWDRMIKIMLFSLITILLMQDKQRLNWLVIVIVVSLGFFGVKGGIFSILTGGNYLVFGPPDSFFEDNNALALALIMVLPLMRYLHLRADRASVKWAILGAIALMGLAIITSHSRGAFLAGAAMVTFLWLRDPNKFRTGLLILIALPVLVMQMPEQWFERMETISEFQSDGSAMGRINAWWFAWNLALDHPFVGGGFYAFTPDLFQIYAPNPEDFHDAHSIYFEVLAEHGFVGLGLFLALGYLSLRKARSIMKQASGFEDLKWASDLAAMVQVCLVGYAVGGAFLGLAYFDLYYHLVAILVILGVIVADYTKNNVQVASVASEPEPETGAAPPKRSYKGNRQ